MSSGGVCPYCAAPFAASASRCPACYHDLTYAVRVVPPAPEKPMIKTIRRVLDVFLAVDSFCTATALALLALTAYGFLGAGFSGAIPIFMIVSVVIGALVVYGLYHTFEAMRDNVR